MKSIWVMLGLFVLPLVAAGKEGSELVFVRGSGSVDRVFLRNGNEVQEVGVLKTAFSDPIAYAGSGALRVFPSADDAGSNADEAAITVDLPEGAGTRLVVVSKVDGEVVLQCFAMPELAEGQNRTTAVNLSKRDLLVSVGDSEVELSSGASGMLDLSEIAEESYLKVREAEESGRLFLSTIWPRQDKVRHVVLIVDGGTRARPIEARRMKWSVEGF